MCTVSFIPRKTGYALAMNRDEKLTRSTGLPPTRKTVGDHVVLYPSESGGGTWIGLNDTGACLALINWYSVDARVKGDSVSRGMAVTSGSAASTRHFVDDALSTLPLRRINPFRLIGVFPATREIAEWRWDLKELARKNHRWRAQQWISSGFDEPTAQRVRARTFEQAQRQLSAGSLGWLRRLHRSHLPETGPFSTCMHRAEAATVSYTEVIVSPHEALMRYHAGAPCQHSACSIHRLRRVTT